MASAEVSLFGNPLSRDPSAPDPTRPAEDDLFSYDATADSIFGDAREPVPRAEPTSISNSNDSTSKFDLGIDEEVRKRRAPVAKLDQTRLLSANGIPKLQKITKDRLKFRGKGHEFSDVERMLNMYQLWLDDLFPKAKFVDGLAIIEKLGHSKSLQVHRRAWIEESKPKLDREAELDDFVDVEDDDYDAPYNEMLPNKPLTSTEQGPDDQPEEDELDMLLAEDAARKQSENTSHAEPQPLRQTPSDDFADDMDALRELEEDW